MGVGLLLARIFCTSTTSAGISDMGGGGGGRVILRGNVLLTLS